MKTLLTLLFSLPLYAGTTASLLIKGTVPVFMDVSISPEIVATTLPLEQSQSFLKIATVSERSNSFTGYKIQISSQNNGYLNSGTNSLHYNLTYNGNSVNLVTGQEFSYNFTNASVKTRDVSISYTADENLPADEYSDTLTFTMSAN